MTVFFRMRLSIHDAAARAIDEQASAIQREVRQGIPAPARPKAVWVPDRHATTIDAGDLIGPIRRSQFGPFAHIASGQGIAGRILAGTAANAFADLVEKLWKALKPRQLVSMETVQDVANEWLLESQAATTLSAYLLPKLEALVATLDVWIPIAELHVQSPIAVGRVTFQTITREKIATWTTATEAYLRMGSAERKHVDDYAAGLDKKYRGFAAGVVRVEGDRNAARKIAMERIGDALSMLRFFSTPALVPTWQSHCALSGQENIETYFAVFESNGIFDGLVKGLLNHHGAPWSIPSCEIPELMGAGLAKLGAMLDLDLRSDFQDAVLTAVRLFSESTRDGRMSTRLVLMLAALEGIFVKDSSEPISQNLGERIAIVTQDSADERMKVIQLVRRIYAFRSKFIHHSEAVDANEDIAAFAKIAWFALIHVLRVVDVFVETRQFVEHVDQLKMSGQPFPK